MVHCMSGISFGCIVWCPSVFTALQALKAFHWSAMAFSMCSFHHQVIRCQRCGRVVPHTSSVVLSSPVLMLFQISSVAPSATPADVLTCKLKTWKWLLVWGSLSFQTLRWGVNLRLDFGGTSILMLHTRSWCCRATSLPESLLHLWQVCAWSYGKGWTLSVWLFPDLYLMRWLSCFFKHVFPRSRPKLGHTLGFSHLQHLVRACHTPSHHALPCIQCLHGLHGRSNLHMGSEILMLGVWQSQQAADQRTGPWTSSLRPLCGAYTDRKVTTCWLWVSLRWFCRRLSEPQKLSLATLLPQTLQHQLCLCRFLTSRACTWCPCPWLCGSCHHGIWSPECSRHPLSCGIVFPLPRKLFLSGCSHWVFPP